MTFPFLYQRFPILSLILTREKLKNIFFETIGNIFGVLSANYDQKKKIRLKRRILSERSVKATDVSLSCYRLYLDRYSGLCV